MSVEALLMTDVKDLGSEGDVVTVANGYARNYLFPRGMAAPVTEATRRRLEKMRQTREAARAAEIESAQAVAARLAGTSCTIPVKVGEEDKLFGSVTSSDIANMLVSQGFEIERHKIELEHPIKDLGVYDVKIRLHAEVEGSVKVWVVEE